MFDIFHKSLKNKLIISFLLIGFLPFIIFLIYTIYLSESKIVDKLISEQHHRADVQSQLINNHLLSLSKEVSFLARLDLMDDILVEDIDKRISRLLIHKKEDYNEALDFYIINPQQIIVSSSNKELISKISELSKYFTLDKGSFIKYKRLYFYAKVFSSFEKDKNLGFLVLEYDLNNLTPFLSSRDHVHSFLQDSKSKDYIGKKLSFDINMNTQAQSLSQNNFLIVYQQMPIIMQNWNIVYAVKKEVALAFLYDFIRFMLYLSPLILLLIIFISIRYAKHIIKPIYTLTKGTDNIIYSKDYSTALKVSSKDEIGRLAHSFNTLLHTTDKALNKLEVENKLRLQRFIQLIEIFNTIIQTQDEDECIQFSLQEIQKLTRSKKISFTKQKAQGISLYVNDFTKQEQVYFGCIELDLEEIEDENEKRFYEAIAKMIVLQLDKIRLINKTQDASQAKSSFISNMSHELKTPLNAIIGFSQYMITYEELNDEQLDLISNIESSAQYLLEMIYGILDIAKIEAGKMQAYIEDIDPVRLLEETKNMLEPLATDKGLELELNYENYLPKTYKSDEKMLKQIVLNLLSNAIKFTKKGSITLELSNTDPALRICVTDTGIGLEEKELGELFTDFTQVQSIMQKEHKGTGLGLSLSKKLANILGGDVKLESLGKGFGVKATFELNET